MDEDVEGLSIAHLSVCTHTVLLRIDIALHCSMYSYAFDGMCFWWMCKYASTKPKYIRTYKCDYILQTAYGIHLYELKT